MFTSIREEIFQLISTICPFDAIEKEHQDFVKNWMESGSEIFRITKPNQPAIHLVSYFVLLDLFHQEILLVDHKKAQLWLPPGGHVERNEHPKETVRRESREELGIEANFLSEDPQFLTVTNTVGNEAIHTDVSLWYILRGSRKEAYAMEQNEFNQIQWFKWDKVPYERSEPHLKRFVQKLMGLKSYDKF